MNQSEFETIASKLRDKALATARRISPTNDDAQDTASDVMLRLWTLRHQLKHAAHALKLATIISHNISIDRKYYTGHTWGAAQDYDLCVDSCRLGETGTADIISLYVEKSARL